MRLPALDVRAILAPLMGRVCADLGGRRLQRKIVSSTK
jgi:hypothetical protein